MTSFAMTDPDDHDTVTHGEWAALVTAPPAPSAEPVLLPLLTVAAEPPTWRAHANCRDVDLALFYPGRGEPAGPAKDVCAGCPVREQCLECGLLERFGVWGGASERERRRIRRQRSLAGHDDARAAS